MEKKSKSGQGKLEYEKIKESLKKLPKDDEYRRRALLLKRYMIEDETAKVAVSDIENGIFNDIFSGEESALASRLFELIKSEFKIKTEKDLMDVYLMIANFIKAKRFLRYRSDALDKENWASMIAKRFQDEYIVLGRELGLSRKDRLVRKIKQVDSTGSLTEIFAAIDQVEVPAPGKKSDI